MHMHMHVTYIHSKENIPGSGDECHVSSVLVKVRLAVHELFLFNESMVHCTCSASMGAYNSTFERAHSYESEWYLDSFNFT
jgi:hypothetical protein